MSSSALSRLRIRAIACLGIGLLVTSGRAEPPNGKSGDAATSTDSAHWVSEATRLVDELTEVGNAYPRSAPPKSWAELVSNQEYREWLSNSDAREAALDRPPEPLLWKLWQITGMPPLLYEPAESTFDYCGRNALAYREYVAKHAELSEEARHRIGLRNAIGSIGSPLWYMTLKYLAERASLSLETNIHISTTPSSILKTVPLNEVAYARLSAALSRWLEANQGRMAWDQRQGKFRAVGGKYLGTDELTRVIVTQMSSGAGSEEALRNARGRDAVRSMY